MKRDELVGIARDAFTARQVYADPVAQDGTTVIAAAKVMGGAGGGGGHDQQGQEGEGGGFGLRARPSGAFVIKAGEVRWLPAVDVNRVFAIVGAVVITLLVTRTRVVKLRAKNPSAFS